MRWRTHDPQLLKGVLPTLVLAALRSQESYGYELVTRLQDAGLTGVAAGTIYPVLTRLEREGALTARLVESSAGPARKYYSLTAEGSVRLVYGLDGWEGLGLVVSELTTSPAPPLGPAPTVSPHDNVRKEDQP
jgi:PadR family transcriptional regulator, regulatory protein PadR